MYVLYITITENVLNIGFNLLFVYGFDMRADGVALGTVCAQYLALMLAFSLLYFRYYQQIHKHKFIAIVKLKELFHYFKVNADIMIRTLALMFAFAFFTVKSSSYNDVLLASNMILMQCMIFFAYVIDGLAHAGESLSGYFYGAGKNKALRLLIRRVFLWSLGLAVIFSLVYFIFFENILELLTNRPNVIETAYRFRFWLAAIPLLSFAAFVWDGIYIGLTATSYLRNAMLLSLLVIYLPVFYIVSAFADEHALWIAMSAFMLARGGFLWFFSSKLPPFQKQPVLFI
jgi:multidrug resistance protein, MATE family